MSPFWSAANTTSVVPRFSLYDIWYPFFANAWPYTCPRTCAPGRFFEPIVSEPLLPPWLGLALLNAGAAKTSVSPISIAPSARPGNRTRALIIPSSFLLGPRALLPPPGAAARPLLVRPPGPRLRRGAPDAHSHEGRATPSGAAARRARTRTRSRAEPRAPRP